MPLTTCPVCKNPVATAAATCPKCGAPIKKEIAIFVLRILILLLVVIGLILSLANGSPIGIAVTGVLLLLVVVAK